ECGSALTTMSTLGHKRLFRPSVMVAKMTLIASGRFLSIQIRGESSGFCESCSAAKDSRCCAAQAANAQSGARAMRKTWLAPKKYDNVIPGPVQRVIRIGRRDRILCAQETLSMAVAASASKPAGNTGSIAIIGLLFFIFGFVTWLNGPLISFAKLAFDVSETLAFLI